ncbi:TPA: YadA-like family protein [Escherichia coli]|uniref:YadA-like family protein n=1 Tax=Escherichia coli TaxID=562 RepID=UPI001C40485D|nr:YadA-like family protein [Escherichia coli]HCO7410654.1 YadA-like family protein [Escherichia coli]
MSKAKKHVSYSLTVVAMLSATIICQTARADVTTPNITGDNNNTTTQFSGNIYGSGNTVTSASNSLVVGNRNSVEGGYNSIVIGNSSTVKASGVIRKVGENIVLDGYSVSIGNATRINGDSSVAIGLTSSVTGNNSIALGSHSSATGDNIVSVGSDTLKRRITNLAQGKDDHDAVNLMQMNTTVNREAEERIKSTDNLQNQINTLSDQVMDETRSRMEGDVATLAAARAHSDENDKKTLASAHTYTDQKETTINNRTDGLLTTERQARIAGDAATLAAATAYSDAGDLLTLKQATTYSDISASRALSEANRYTDNKFRNLNNKIERAEKRLNAGIAGVTAISSIPYVAENSFSYGIGVGNYQNANAVAAGIQYKTSRNTNIRLNISWDSSHNTAIGAGVACGW